MTVDDEQKLIDRSTSWVRRNYGCKGYDAARMNELAYAYRKGVQNGLTLDQLHKRKAREAVDPNKCGTCGFLRTSYAHEEICGSNKL